MLVESVDGGHEGSRGVAAVGLRGRQDGQLSGKHTLVPPYLMELQLGEKIEAGQQEPFHVLERREMELRGKEGKRRGKDPLVWSAAARWRR